MGAQTMAAVLQLQTQPPSDGDVANQLIDSLDSNGDGEVSLDEIQTAFKDAGIDADASSAFDKVDANGDGQIDASELTSAVSSARQHHGHHHGPPPTSSDRASSILSAFDTDGTAGLSLDETASALGQSSDTLKSAFASFDADGDGVLSTQELSSAIDAQMLAAQRAYAAQLTQTAGLDQAASSI